MLGAFLALIILMNPPSPDAVATLDQALNDECAYIGNAVDADYCAYQFTDIAVSTGGVITARAQFSAGCEGEHGALQEAEYIVAVRLDTGAMVRADRIESPHLPDGGVATFLPMQCDIQMF